MSDASHYVGRTIILSGTAGRRRTSKYIIVHKSGEPVAVTQSQDLSPCTGAHQMIIIAQRGIQEARSTAKHTHIHALIHTHIPHPPHTRALFTFYMGDFDSGHKVTSKSLAS